MANQKYAIKSLVGTRLARAQRSAILKGSFGVLKTERSHLACMGKLRYRWLKRINLLRQEDPDLFPDRKWTYMVHCPPCGVMTTQQGKLIPCCVRKLCPFCWARHCVQEPFNRLRYWLLDQGRELRLLYLRTKLLPSRVKDHDPEDVTQGTLGRVIHLRPGPLLERRFAGIPIEGAMVGVYCRPTRGGKWGADIQAILLMDPSLIVTEAAWNPAKAPPFKIRSIDPRDITLRGIQHCCAGFGQYPASLLSDAPLAQYLRLSKGAKTMMSYGLLRQPIDSGERDAP